MYFHIDGIPEVYKYTTEGDYNVMVMELLGPSLEELFQACNRKFSLETVNKIGFQGMRIIANIQKKGFIHRDIKPDNYLIGLGPKIRNIYIIDFGLAKRFIDPQTNTHIFYKQNKNLTETARYASINTHCGEEQSRRDDFEGMLYVLLYLLKGCLPWQGVDANNKLTKYEKILQIKKQWVPKAICDKLPSYFFELLCYVRSMNFLDEPNYQYIISKFQDNSINEFDWIIKKSVIIIR